MEKKSVIFSLILLLSLFLSFTGCDSSGGDSSGSSADSPLSADRDDLKIDYQGSSSLNAIVNDIKLPTVGPNGSTITWRSSDKTVVELDGTVTRPSSGSVSSSYISKMVKSAGTDETGLLSLNTSSLVNLSDVKALNKADGDKNVTLTATISKDGERIIKEFVLTVIEAPLSDDEAVAEDASVLDIGYNGDDVAAEVTKDLDLDTSGSSGTAISWSSSEPGIIAEDGTVTRQSVDSAVILTATVSKGTAEPVTLDFELTVLATTESNEDAVATDTESLEIGYSSCDSAGAVTGDIVLKTRGSNGTTISWLSSIPIVIASDGTVNLPTSNNVEVTLTATISRGEAEATKEFKLTVLEEWRHNITGMWTFTSGFIRETININGDGTSGQIVVICIDMAVNWAANPIPIVISDAIAGTYEMDHYGNMVITVEKDFNPATEDFDNLVQGYTGYNYFTYDSISNELQSKITGEKRTFVKISDNDWRDHIDGSWFFIKNNDGTKWTFDINSDNSYLWQVWSDNTESLLLWGTRGSFTGDMNFYGECEHSRVETYDYDGSSWISDPLVNNAQYYMLSTTLFLYKDANMWCLFYPRGGYTVPDVEAVARAREDLIIDYYPLNDASCVTENLGLRERCSYDTTITWSSSNTSVINIELDYFMEDYEGWVTRPAAGEDSISVTITATITKGEASTTKEFVLTVLPEFESDSAAVDFYKGLLEVTFSPVVVSITQKFYNVELINYAPDGILINWSSSHPLIISADGGLLNRPEIGAGDATVLLTATLTKGAATGTKEFVLTISEDTITYADAVEAATNDLEIDYMPGDNEDSVTDYVGLAFFGLYSTSIIWTSSNPSVIDEIGWVTRPASGENDVEVTLTATISRGTVSETKVFVVTVLAEE